MNLTESKLQSAREPDFSETVTQEEDFHLKIKNSVCPDCGGKLYHSGGCPVCIVCGWSRCG